MVLSHYITQTNLEKRFASIGTRSSTIAIAMAPSRSWQGRSTKLKKNLEKVLLNQSTALGHSCHRKSAMQLLVAMFQEQNSYALEMLSLTSWNELINCLKG